MPHVGHIQKDICLLCIPCKADQSVWDVGNYACMLLLLCHTFQGCEIGPAAAVT